MEQFAKGKIVAPLHFKKSHVEVSWVQLTSLHLPAANKDELVNTEFNCNLENTRIWRPKSVTVKLHNMFQRQADNDLRKEIIIF